MIKTTFLMMNFNTKEFIKIGQDYKDIILQLLQGKTTESQQRNIRLQTNIHEQNLEDRIKTRNYNQF